MFGIHTGLKKYESKVQNSKPASQGAAQARLGKVGQTSSDDSSSDRVTLSAEARAAGPQFGIPNPNPPQLPSRGRDDRQPAGEATVEFTERLNDTRDVLRDNFSEIADDDGRISRDDLERALSEGGEIADAANFLLANQAVRNLFDTGSGRGGVDGSISERDVRGVMFRENNPFEDSQSFDDPDQILSDRFFDLADTAAGRGGADGNVSAEDIISLGDNNPDIPRELLDALSQYAF